MRKIVTVAGLVAVLGIGGGMVVNSLLRSSDDLGHVGSTLPERTVRSAPVPAPNESPSSATPRSSTPIDAAANADEQSQESVAEEHGPFGHAGNEPLQADHPTTLPDSPAGEATGDATSLAPLLSDTRARLEELLADAEPGAAAELATLLGARAPIEALLDNSDPAVREEAAALLQLLAKAAQ